MLIVKANENRIPYGNTIELDFLLTELNSLLKNVANMAAFGLSIEQGAIFDLVGSSFGII